MKTQDRNAMLGVRIRDRRSADAPVPPTEGLSSFVRFVDNEVVLLLCPLPGHPRPPVLAPRAGSVDPPPAWRSPKPAASGMPGSSVSRPLSCSSSMRCRSASVSSSSCCCSGRGAALLANGCAYIAGTRGAGAVVLRPPAILYHTHASLPAPAVPARVHVHSTKATRLRLTLASSGLISAPTPQRSRK